MSSRIDLRHRQARIGRSGSFWHGSNQYETVDWTNGFSVFAWHAPHQSLVAMLASIRSSLDHPVETAYTGVRPANCIASSVTATIVTSFKFRLCLSPLWFAHDPDNVTPAAAWRFNHCEDHRLVIGSSQINHRQAVTRVTVHLCVIIEWVTSKLWIVLNDYARLLLI